MYVNMFDIEDFCFALCGIMGEFATVQIAVTRCWGKLPIIHIISKYEIAHLIRAITFHRMM
jgi:hypothetical protein